MKKIVFISNKYYDFESKSPTIGGLQTYLTDLFDVCRALSLEVDYYQKGDKNETININGINIIQVKVPDNKNHTFCKHVAKVIKEQDVAVIFGTEIIIPKKMVFEHVMAIQHGVYWDIPCNEKRSMLRMVISKLRRNYNYIIPLQKLQQMVCVDYNYVNWLRTETDNVPTKLIVIPNYTKIAPLYEKPKDTINIIFARRLFYYRGTRVFTIAAKRILQEFTNVHITIAGTGPDEAYMKQELSNFKNVQFMTYKSSDSLKIHADKHIAVVPTVGSEGTSLSLLEAMSAQCAVIASNVGGMTNIILDNYNGLLVNAGDPNELYESIKGLILVPSRMELLSKKAYETVQQAFSYEKWYTKWYDVIKKFAE